MQLDCLKTLHMKSPLGIDVNPYFSWILTSEEENVLQTAWWLTVAKKDGTTVWDSGRVEDNRTSYVEYAGEPLESRTCYEWRVTAWDNQGKMATATAHFETAFLDQEEWKAKWAESPFPRIRRKRGFGNQPPATLFRKSFTLKEGLPLRRARLYATCHGIYRISVNGKRPDEREFAPEHTVYKSYLCYQTYDVTTLLQSGENALGMYVGDGWWACPSTRPNMKPYNPSHAILFQLEIDYVDGSRDFVLPDQDVKATTGPVCFSDLFGGEQYDARLELNGWDKAGFDEEGWSLVKLATFGYANLKAQLGQPVCALAELQAVDVIISPKGETIIDFGQVIAGYVQMRVDAPVGTKITLDHTECLDQNGNFFFNIQGSKMVGRGCDQRDVYISNGNSSVYRPLFTFHGFRYLRITGLAVVRKENFTAIVLSSEKEEVGSFECSNQELNRLYQNTRWSQRSNMLSIPTDCPQREKAGWTGDILIYATTSLLNEDTTPFLTRWLYNVSCEQGKNGAIPFVVPYVGDARRLSKLVAGLFGNKGVVASAGWGDAAVIVPWSMYHITGNTAILRQQYDSMKNWCNYVIYTAKTQRGKNRQVTKEVDVYLWNTGFHFGEWFIPSLSKQGYDTKEMVRALRSSLQYTAPIFGWHSVDRMGAIATLLGKEEDAAYYIDIAAKMKDAIGKGVIDENGNMPIELMGAYVLPIYFDLVPEKHKQHFANKLVKILEANDGCLDTGFLGTPYILDALCKIDRLDLAYSLLYQTKCPSWLHQVQHGATSMWESWYAYQPDGTPIVMSQNHYAFGCVDDWMFRYITGIDTDTSGYSNIHIRPQPDESLAWARRTFKSQHGNITCYWEKRDAIFYLEVDIPCNTIATVTLPSEQSYQVGSGHYTFNCKL